MTQSNDALNGALIDTYEKTSSESGSQGAADAAAGVPAGGSAGATAGSSAGEKQGGGVTRRQVLGGIGLAGVGAVAGGVVVAAFQRNDSAEGWQLSDGYLLVDTKKCAGCRTCMLACSLAHYGEASLSLARIQIRSDAFGTFPNDVAQSQCHQCPYPSCVAACPVDAMHIDAQTGVRTVDEDKCIGCERCINACPYTPSRVQWNPKERHAQKCDLCLATPYWDEEGGAHGKQACVEACPMQAIKFTNELPVQDESGYDVNLRNEHYLSLGLPADDEGKVSALRALTTD
jgi:protein NrfC